MNKEQIDEACITEEILTDETQVCPETEEGIPSSILLSAKKSNLINYTQPTYGSFQAIENILGSKNYKKLSSIFDKYDLRFQVKDIINTMRTSLIEALILFNKVGSIIFFQYETCLIQKDDVFFLISIESTNITNLPVYVFSDSIEKSTSYMEFFKSEVSSIHAKNKINMELSWYYYSSPKIVSSYVTEEINDDFMKEAYPYLDVDNIINGYLESDAPIMILLGPPGTGKTRFIRYLIKKMHDKNGSVKVAFTSDQYVIEHSEIFMEFLFGSFNALVIEDIDYHLRPRNEGNATMYNFLTASNSIVINYFKEKKMILSTNLPNVKNIDEALLRPGRCFDIIETRPLITEETKNLLKILNKNDIFPEKKYTIAEIFNSRNDKDIKKSGF